MQTRQQKYRHECTRFGKHLVSRRVHDEHRNSNRQHFSNEEEQYLASIVEARDWFGQPYTPREVRELAAALKRITDPGHPFSTKYVRSPSNFAGILAHIFSCATGRESCPAMNGLGDIGTSLT